MKLTGYAKIFLTASVILIASILIVLGSDITLKEMWSNYFSQPDPWVGIFTSIGAIFTVCVFIATVYATRKAGESAKIAGEALELSRESGRKDDFIKQFTLLIEQHNKSHEIMMKVLNTYRIGKNNDIDWNMTIKEASDKLYLNHQFSPYMRMLFRVLKHCDENFYIQGDTNEIIKEKKKYTSIVRSMIRNDVLYFVAINSMNEREIFNEYRKKLKKFDFFEHLIIDEISSSIKFNIDKFYNGDNHPSHFLKAIIKQCLYEKINKEIIFSDFHMKDNNEKVVNDIFCSFNYEIASEYVSYKQKEFKENILKLIDFEGCFDFVFNDIKSKMMKFNIINDKLHLFKYDGKPSDDGGFKNEKILEKSNDFNLTTEGLFIEILDEKINGIKEFERYIKNTYGFDNFIFIIGDEGSNNRMSNHRIYNELFSYYIYNKVIKKITTNKDALYNEILDETIVKMNETFLINNLKEKFIRDNNNITFCKK